MEPHGANFYDLKKPYYDSNLKGEFTKHVSFSKWLLLTDFCINFAHIRLVITPNLGLKNLKRLLTMDVAGAAIYKEI